MTKKSETLVDQTSTQTEVVTIENGRVRVRSYNRQPSRTQQQHADACDINQIMRRFKLTGQVSHLRNGAGSFADTTSVSDYHEMMNKVITAQDSFMTLPSELRLQFDNDPARLLEFLADPKNDEQAVKLGLKQYVNANKNDESQTTNINANTKPKESTTANESIPNSTDSKNQ